MVDATDKVSIGHDTWTEDLRRKEQDTINRIVHGDDTGQYYLIFGCRVWPLRVRHRITTYQLSRFAGDWKNDYDIRCNASQPGRRCLHV
jgi:hypothetical protein